VLNSPAITPDFSGFAKNICAVAVFGFFNALPKLPIFSKAEAKPSGYRVDKAPVANIHAALISPAAKE
jgi:hypothetical protein